MLHSLFTPHSITDSIDHIVHGDVHPQLQTDAVSTFCREGICLAVSLRISVDMNMNVV